MASERVTMEFRRCANIRSRKHSDVKCASPATHGDFCGKHYKKPIRFFDRRQNDQRNIYTRSQNAAVSRIQKWWKKKNGLKRFIYQGPAVFNKNLSQNETEVYSLDSIKQIPQVFFFSYADCKKNIWSFDIRSLLNLLSQGHSLQNPYTREPIPEQVVERFRNRVEWLRKRKFILLYGLEETITPEQEWNHKVLDIFMKIEALGYLLSTSWFHELNLEEHQSFYRELYKLWHWRLGLTNAERNEICPGHLSNSQRLFKEIPDEAVRRHQEIRWWQKQNLGIIQSLVTRGTSKSSKSLGALYIVMGLVQVSDAAAEGYPWILETLEAD